VKLWHTLITKTPSPLCRRFLHFWCCGQRRIGANLNRAVCFQLRRQNLVTLALAFATTISSLSSDPLDFLVPSLWSGTLSATTFSAAYPRGRAYCPFPFLSPWIRLFGWQASLSHGYLLFPFFPSLSHAQPATILYAEVPRGKAL